MTEQSNLSGAPEGAPESLDGYLDPPKREVERERILIGIANSFNLLLSGYKTVVTNDGLSAAKEAVFPLNLTSAPIEGLPETAGGCALKITPALTRKIGYRRHDAKTDTWEDPNDAYDRLIAEIEGRSNYGIRFVFIDDPRATRVLDQLRAQARKEAAVTQEALTVGVMRSDMALPEDRIY
jgi:hypothetical protein